MHEKNTILLILIFENLTYITLTVNVISQTYNCREDTIRQYS